MRSLRNSQNHICRRLFPSLMVLVIGLTVSSCIPQKVLNFALKRDAEKDLQRYEADLGRFKFWNRQWSESLKDTFMLSPNNQARLHALYRQASQPTRNTAFIMHGYTCNAATLLNMARFYSDEMGYNVFLPDFYAHGKSEGRMRQMGWLDRLDMLEWMKMANSIFSHDGEETQMLVTGVSMGGATTMMVSGEVENHRLTFVKCFVEDCGYSNVYDQFKSVSKGRFEWVLKWADRRCQRKYGWGFKEASSVHQVQQCHLPMLFIHGGSDTYVPTDMVNDVYNVKDGERDLWIPAGVEHARSFDKRNAEYRKRVKEFAMKYIQ